eukprot:scaffold230843_cov28-Tisochrysis_lutea.AAC.2
MVTSLPMRPLATSTSWTGRASCDTSTEMPEALTTPACAELCVTSSPTRAATVASSDHRPSSSSGELSSRSAGGGQACSSWQKAG